MYRLLILTLLLIVVPVANAQSSETLQIDEVVVTATRYGERITDIPAHITVISEKDIDTSTAQNIPDLLKTEAGLHVSDITGNRRAFTVDLRGFGESAPSNTLVLVDGRKINQADLSGADWMNIPLERVRRIEIIRGGRGAVLYGDNATGGVINIITKEGDQLAGSVDITAGSYGTFKAGSHVSGSLNNLSLHLSGDYLTSDGYRDNSDTESRDIGFNTAYYMKDFMKIQLSGGYHKDKTGLPGALKESDFAAGASRTDSIFPDDFAETEDYYVKLTPEISFAGESTIKIDASFRKRNFLSFSSGDWGNFLGDSEIKTTAVSPQIIFKKDFQQIANTLTAGFDYQKADNDIVNDSLFFGSRTTGMFTLEKENTGYYVHDEITMANNLRFSGGYRYDRAKFTFDPAVPDGVTFSQDNYTAGINYAFLKKSFVYVSYSRSFRYPLLDELYSFISNTISTNLKSQISDSYEAGLRYYFTENIHSHVNVFRLDTDDEIFFNPLTFANENLDGMTRREGIEISCDARATSWLTIRGSYTYLKAKIKDGVFRSEDVPNVPNHKATLEVISDIGRGFTAGLNGVYVGERPFISDFANDFGDQKEYLVLNAKFAYHWKTFKAFLDLNNLTNKEYAEYGVIGGFPAEKAFYPSPKRNVIIGVSYVF